MYIKSKLRSEVYFVMHDETRRIIVAVCLVLIMLLVFYVAYENFNLHKKLQEQFRQVEGAEQAQEPEPTQRDRIFVVLDANPNEINVQVQEPQQHENHEEIPDRGLTYFDEISYNNHNDDKQNSHNSQILRDLESRWNKLSELNQQEQTPELINTAFREMKRYISSCTTLTDKDRQKIQKVIKMAERGYLFGSFQSGNVKENWVLTQVWIRIHNSANDANRPSMLTAFIDQLKDAGKEVDTLGAAVINRLANAMGMNVQQDTVATECMTGRIQRYFQIFTLLDADSLLAAPVKDDKEYENEAYTKCANILKQELDKDKTLAELYSRQEEELDVDEASQLASFKQRVKNLIEQSLRADYTDLIPNEHLDSIIVKCHAGI